MAVSTFTDGEPETETWKDVADWPYQVSSLGRVRRTRDRYGRRSDRLLKPNPTGRYQAVCFCARGRKRHVRIHCLVAEVFLGARPKGQEVNHRDGCKTNNRAANLEYLTPPLHVEHSVLHQLMARGDSHHARARPETVARGSRQGGAKLDEAIVAQIKGLLRVGYKHQDIAAQFGVSRATVSYIHLGHTWRHVT